MLTTATAHSGEAIRRPNARESSTRSGRTPQLQTAPLSRPHCEGSSDGHTTRHPAARGSRKALLDLPYPACEFFAIGGVFGSYAPVGQLAPVILIFIKRLLSEGSYHAKDGLNWEPAAGPDNLERGR